MTLNIWMTRQIRVHPGIVGSYKIDKIVLSISSLRNLMLLQTQVVLQQIHLVELNVVLHN